MDESPLAFAERWRRDLQTLADGLMPDSDRAKTAEVVKRLSLELNERARDLPAYELQKCQQELEAVQRKLCDSAAKAAPKPRFVFKKREPPSASTSKPSAPSPMAPAATSASHPPTPSAPPARAAAPEDALALTNRTRAYFTRADLPFPSTFSSANTGSAPSSSQCLALSSLTSCVVDLLDTRSNAGASGSSYSAFYLSDLEDSVILLQANERRGSVLVQNCRGCVFILGGHQIRIHDSTKCRFFLAAGSQPIIERCRDLIFAPYPVSLQPTLSEPDQPSRLDVQDFDDPFATAERPSPNWRRATEAEQASTKDVLAQFVTAGEGEGRHAGCQEALEALLPQQTV
ncbi:hypothetical protein JCM10908_003181 [Rhodotorula pacifica]|uniref:uncharacterized protein n=1 Tax=Rhodotorula pacifica TaxID=1495444 RepID=UPI0031712298